MKIGTTLLITFLLVSMSCADLLLQTLFDSSNLGSGVGNEVAFNVSGNEFHSKSYVSLTNAIRFVAEFSDDQDELRSKGMGRRGHISFLGAWDSASRNPAGDVDSKSYKLGVLLNGTGTDRVVANVAGMTVESIPEPAVVSLIGIFGGGIIFCRRIFGNRKEDPNS